MTLRRSEQQADVVVIIDEAYVDFADGPSARTLIEKYRKSFLHVPQNKLCHLQTPSQTLSLQHKSMPAKEIFASLKERNIFLRYLTNQVLIIICVSQSVPMNRW